LKKDKREQRLGRRGRERAKVEKGQKRRENKDP